MRGKLILAVVMASLTAAGGGADDKKAAENVGLEKFKKLAGDWAGKGSDGKQSFDATANYKVTSNGSAVVETLGAGSPHEMVSIIHADGDKLALTHYCGLGNQPHMKADVKETDKAVAFKFASATNLKSDKDMHMHDVTFTFVDADTLKVEWSLYNDRKQAGTMTFEMKRKK